MASEGFAWTSECVADRKQGARLHPFVEDELPNDWERVVAQRAGVRHGHVACCGVERRPYRSKGGGIEPNGFLRRSPECGLCGGGIDLDDVVFECAWCGSTACAECTRPAEREARSRSRSRSR